MFPLCGIKILTQTAKEKSPTENETEATISKAEERLVSNNELDLILVNTHSVTVCFKCE